jgi:signal transduction histidine kinase
MATRGAAEPAVYLSALRAVLDAASGVAEERAQGIAEAVVQELAVETCAVTLRRHGEPGLRLVGHARRWDAGARPLEAEEALAVGRLAVPDGGALCCARREGGEFRPARVADLAGEGCVVLPVDAGGGAFASVVVHARDAAAGLVPHLGALGLVAEVTGLVLAARDDEPASRAVRLPARAVSHRLRNPLHAILGYSNLVRDGAAGAVNEEQARLLDRVLANSQQLNVVIDDLLFFVEIEAGRVAVRPEPVAFRELVDEVVAALAPPLDGGAVAFRLEMAVGAETLDTDRGVLRRLLFHLLGNAFRYTTQGEVTVAVRPGDDEHVQILVRDTGSGISPESARVLAEPAPRAPGAAGPDHGLGMGLSLVRRCVRLLGGRITVRSAPHQGSEFLLRLPRTLRVRGSEKTPDTLH